MKIVLLRGMGYHSQKKRRLAYHGVCWGFPALCVVLAIVLESYNSNGSALPWCLLDTVWQWPLLYLPVAFFSCIGMGLTICILIKLFQVRTPSHLRPCLHSVHHFFNLCIDVSSITRVCVCVCAMSLLCTDTVNAERPGWTKTPFNHTICESECATESRRLCLHLN